MSKPTLGGGGERGRQRRQHVYVTNNVEYYNHTNRQLTCMQKRHRCDWGKEQDLRPN
jgi:hypothetical protein